MARKLEGYGPLGVLVNILSSFWLACVLLGCMMYLTFFGTYAQIDIGLFEATKVYFTSWFLWRDLGSFALPYFPGGKLCMALLALNMFTGGFIRMRITKRNVGVVVVHIGIAFMLIAGLVKLQWSEEGKIGLMEGETSSYFDSFQLWEVAIWDMDQPFTGNELVIPDVHLSDLTGDKKRTFSHPDLPFELELSGFVKNCSVQPKGPNWQAAGPVVEGWGFYQQDPMVDAERNVGGLHANVLANGRVQPGLLWGRQFAPWTVEAGGKRWAIDMRNERYPMPFSIQLDDFIKDDHPGMSMARAFKSHVTKIDADGSQEKVLIQMNEPLREGNLVLFQSSFNQFNGREYSVFSVVRNVSDKWPEYSLWVTTVGMLWVFGTKLILFVRRQSKRAAAPGGTS